MFPVNLTTTPERAKRRHVDVDLDELQALIKAGMVRIVPELIPEEEASFYGRQQILDFIANRPDLNKAAVNRNDEEPLPTTMDPREASIGRGMERP